MWAECVQINFGFVVKTDYVVDQFVLCLIGNSILLGLRVKVHVADSGHEDDHVVGVVGQASDGLRYHRSNAATFYVCDFGFNKWWLHGLKVIS